MQSVKNYVERNRLTLAQFAEQIGVSRSMVCYLISGDRHPSLHLLRKIHEVTAIPVKTLLYECT
jgi:transcriptional regulator with XRE-family HTH domain